jgi:hypothetical protein
VRKPESFDVGPTESGAWDWHTLLTSVLFHVCLVLILVLWQRTHISPPDPPGRTEQQVVLADPVTFEQPREQPSSPPVTLPDRPIPLGPDSDQPDSPVAQEQGDPTPIPEDAPLTPDPGGKPDVVEAPPEASNQKIQTPPDLAGRPSRIVAPPVSPFGTRPSTVTLPPGRTIASAGAFGRAGLGTQDTRGFRQSFENAAGQCPEIPDPGVNPDGTPVLFSVVGIVRDDRGRPLPNAHLQLMGQIYATFSDGQGNYRLEFNPKLLDACRVQVVRVSAEGFRTADLQLAVGRRVQSDDVVLRRR